MTRTPQFVALALSLVAASACGPSGSKNGDDDTIDAGGIVTTPDAALPMCATASAGGFTFEKIATWRDDAKGAYTLIHDDLCDDTVEGIHINAAPALAAAGIHAAVGAIVGECQDSDRWNEVTDLENAGHEVINHSMTHIQISTANAPTEVVASKKMLDMHVKNPVTFFIFPYDYFTADTIAAVAAAGHFGERAGNRDDNDGFKMPPINPSTPTNDSQVEFDVWPRSFSKYALYYPEDVLTVHAYNAIEAGGWAVREFHSVVADGATTSGATDGNGFGPIEITPYKKHLQFLADARAKGILWTAPPSAVIRYRHAAAACKASVSGDMIKFDTSSADCTKWATPISVIVTTSDDLPRVDGTQGGNPVSSVKLGAKRFSITADPTKGPVSLSGCSNDGYSINPDQPVAPRPTAAASVCDIETVKGAGGAGKMDDLERPADEFQLLPNPSQADGRTGTWSWYPQQATVEMAADGASNHVLHYAGTNIGAWSGVTLAFLESNGAGSCYDGTKYTGIKFRIKGTVTSTDLPGQIVVSLVTAKTQSRTYGGDLDGSGGHFHKVIPVSASWTTVQIPWTDLLVPSWGDTTSLTAVAKEALQAIDFGVSDKTSKFDVDIDDIQMY